MFNRVAKKVNAQLYFTVIFQAKYQLPVLSLAVTYYRYYRLPITGYLLSGSHFKKMSVTTNQLNISFIKQSLLNIYEV